MRQKRGKRRLSNCTRFLQREMERNLARRECCVQVEIIGEFPRVFWAIQPMSAQPRSLLTLAGRFKSDPSDRLPGSEQFTDFHAVRPRAVYRSRKAADCFLHGRALRH